MRVGRSDHNYDPQGSHSTTDHWKLESEAGHAQSTVGPCGPGCTCVGSNSRCGISGTGTNGGIEAGLRVQNHRSTRSETWVRWRQLL